jgi:acetyl-CoA carboxylase biotin carboxyl carrier protein
LDLEDIERILDLVKAHDLAEFELEREGLKLRVRKASADHAGTPPSHVTQALPPTQAPAMMAVTVPQAAAAALTAPTQDEDALELAVVKSPIVGTFYRAPEPSAPPFVEVGQRVRKDQVLCIIEAMKLMNEITSEYDGEIVSVYVENGNPVQYGERLFAVKTS